jgi:S1-C subfamily serine protease
LKEHNVNHFTVVPMVCFLLSVKLIVACGASKESEQSATGSQGPSGSSGPQGPAGNPGTNGMPGVSFQEATRKLLELLQPKRTSVVDLICGGGSGTGTRIGEDTVITAFHVIEGETSCVVRSNGLQVAVGGMMSRSPSGRDIGYIKNLNFNSTVPVVVPAKGAQPMVGDMLVLLSHPSDLRSDLQTSLGFVTDDNAQSSLGSMGTEWRDAIISDMAAGPGSSGGPIFNSVGDFVGIHVGGFGDSSGGVELNFQLIFSTED